MNTEEAIGMVCIGREQPLEPDEAHEIVELLKRGEKFEKMWGNFKTINREYFSNFEVRANHIIRMEELEQKYFPKPKTTKGKINDIMTKLRDLDIHPRGEIIKMLIELRDEEEIK